MKSYFHIVVFSNVNDVSCRRVSTLNERKLVLYNKLDIVVVVTTQVIISGESRAQSIHRIFCVCYYIFHGVYFIDITQNNTIIYVQVSCRNVKNRKKKPYPNIIHIIILYEWEFNINDSTGLSCVCIYTYICIRCARRMLMRTTTRRNNL